MAPQKRYAKGTKKITNYAVSNALKNCIRQSQAATKIQQAWRGRKRKVVAGPKKQKGSVAKALASVAERKLQQLTPQYNVTPKFQTLTPGTGPVCYQNYILGDQPSAWTGPIGSTTGPNYTALGGYTFPGGTGSNGRIGRYMFLERCSMNLSVCLKAVPDRHTQPLQFRLLVYKFKRNDTLGSIGNPNDDLFLSSTGGNLGFNTAFDNSVSPGKASFELMNAIVNKKNYEVFRDEKFVLTHQSSVPQGGGFVPLSYSGNIQKDFQLQLNHNQKTSFGGNDKPDDLKYQYCITVISAPMGDMDHINNNEWRTFVRGTVSAMDS